MKKKNNDRKMREDRKADPRLAADRPTAFSPEFVPKPEASADASFTNGSDAVFDFIPGLKSTDRFK